MAKKDFTMLTAAESVSLTDILAVVVDPSGSPATKKATLQKLKDLLLTSENLAALNVITSDDINDYLPWEETASGLVYNERGDEKNVGVGEASPDKTLVVGGDFKVKKGTIPASYNLPGATYSKFIVSRSTNPRGIAWNNDGTKMYEIDRDDDKIYQYDVSTPFDISTATYNSVNMDTLNSEPKGLTWNNDGTKLYEIGEEYYEYDVSTPFDISTAVYNSVTLSPQAPNTSGMVWNNDGTKLYEVGFTDDKIYEYTLSTAFDISTATATGSSVSTQDIGPTDILWNDDGTKLYELGCSTAKIYQYDVSTPFDISTATYNGVNIDTQDADPNGITWSNDGSKLYEIGSDSARIYEYDISGDTFGGDSTFVQLSADPDDPAEGESVEWYSDGTGSGNAGDKMAKVNVGGTVTTKTIIGYSQNVTTVNAATYDLLTTDYILNVTYTGTGAVTSLTLPSAQTVSGRVIIVKDAGGNAGSNNITIDTEGAETIDGAATKVISTNYESVHLYSDGSNWFII